MNSNDVLLIKRHYFFLFDINVSVNQIVLGRNDAWTKWLTHYRDVIMGAMASQIPRLTIVCSTVYRDADQRKHQSSASLAFVRGIHRGPVNFPHKWPVTWKVFPFDDVIMQNITRINSDHVYWRLIVSLLKSHHITSLMKQGLVFFTGPYFQSMDTWWFWFLWLPEPECSSVGKNQWDPRRRGAEWTGSKMHSCV